MQYTFDLVEAAALWVGADPLAIRRQMDNSDYQKIKSNYEYELHQAKQNWLNWSEWFKSRREICLECTKEPSCPEFDWQDSQDGTEVAVLQCPRGWNEKPPEEELSPYYFGVGPMPSLRKRYIPKAGEFTDLPDYVERIEWLKNALVRISANVTGHFS